MTEKHPHASGERELDGAIQWVHLSSRRDFTARIPDIYPHETLFKVPLGVTWKLEPLYEAEKTDD